ncbi:MAG: thioesterase [Saprospiraceae bacterium]
MPLTYTTAYTVQTYDIDKRRRMTVAALVKQMQEAAMQNVMEMKVSVWDMEAQHISWVLLRKNLRINRLPMIGEKLTFYTCPTGFEKVFTFRDYKVFDEAGELIAYSSSSWLLLDTHSRRMSRIPPWILEFEKDMPPAEECLPRPSVKLPSLDHVDFSATFRVYWHDLDFNGHLNNVYYLQWMLETLPDAFLESGTLKAFDIQYKVEGQWKDEIVSETQELENGRFLHRLKLAADGKELAVGMSEWDVV